MFTPLRLKFAGGSMSTPLVFVRQARLQYRLWSNLMGTSASFRGTELAPWV